ncbi:MAG TPA: hypothetical protein DCW68_07355 [Rhodospirillaceae bacterium]|nr:MAG: hypothetical protein A2018_06865 [Alphaproteobacteria bacterium GWF2_58_20]HAU29903.1 hypothetical protein [Rhodospirillaceae bacterium]
MKLHFAQGTSDVDQERIGKALENAARQNPQQAKLVEAMAPRVTFQMSGDLLYHVRFQLDPIAKVLSINAKVQMDDAQLAEGLITRLVLARQSGLDMPPEASPPLVLVKNPESPGVLSRIMNKVAQKMEPLSSVPPVRKGISQKHP